MNTTWNNNKIAAIFHGMSMKMTQGDEDNVGL